MVWTAKHRVQSPARTSKNAKIDEHTANLRSCCFSPPNLVLCEGKPGKRTPRAGKPGKNAALSISAARLRNASGVQRVAGAAIRTSVINATACLAAMAASAVGRFSGSGHERGFVRRRIDSERQAHARSMPELQRAGRRRRLPQAIRNKLRIRFGERRVVPASHAEAAVAKCVQLSTSARQFAEARERTALVLGKEFAGEILGDDADDSGTAGPSLPVRHTVWTKREASARTGHAPEKVNGLFGHLIDQGIPELISASGYSRRDLFALFMQFKALVALSDTPEGIDKDTFRRSMPQLMVEDRLFIDRVYAALDADGSGTIEWDEFIEAMAKLEKGSREERAEFMFNVYDEDKGGSVDKEEMSNYFLSSLRVHDGGGGEAGEAMSGEVASYFVDRVFDTIVPGRDEIERDDMIEYVRQHPEIKDIYGMFGRSMLTSDSVRRMMGSITAKPLVKRTATIDMPRQRSALCKTQAQKLAQRRRRKQAVAQWKREEAMAAALSSAANSRPSSRAAAAAASAQAAASAFGGPSAQEQAGELFHAVAARLGKSSPLARAGQGSMRNLMLSSQDSARFYASSLKSAADRKASSRKLSVGSLDGSAPGL